MNLTEQNSARAHWRQQIAWWERNADRLARAMCDSSSHMNLLPHDEQRPCQYHRDRAKATISALKAQWL